MPIIVCRNCGHKTNTAISDHINSEDELADGCYGRFVDDIIEKGCAYDKASAGYKIYINSLIELEKGMKIKVIEEAKRQLFL